MACRAAASDAQLPTAFLLILLSSTHSHTHVQVWKYKYVHQDVALKLITITHDCEGAVERFWKEVEIQGQLCHTNIVQIRGAVCEEDEVRRGPPHFGGGGVQRPHKITSSQPHLQAPSSSLSFARVFILFARHAQTPLAPSSSSSLSLTFRMALPWLAGAAATMAARPPSLAS